MGHLNIEFKARCDDHEPYRKKLEVMNAYFKGKDHQKDTFFNVVHGRLKLREGTLENYLIYYERRDEIGPKSSNVELFRTKPASNIKNILERALGELRVVEKDREIYFVDNVKVHLDDVKNLGKFIEVEAIDLDGTLGEETLRLQCDKFLRMFKIKEQDLVENSYSDMLPK
jgi:adenylate cyclase, class 2